MRLIKYFSIIVAGTLLSVNCSKTKDDTTDYIRGKIDGVAFECNMNIKANRPHPSYSGVVADPEITVTGEWPMYSIKLNIHGEGTNITTGIYDFQATKHRSAAIWYNSLAYYAGPTSILNSPAVLSGTGKITILEINSSHIKGTFEFAAASGGIPVLLKTVTDGEFYIKRS